MRPMTTLDPRLLLQGYAMGIFPMADSRQSDEVFWVEPRSRAVIPLGRFHLSHSLRRTIRSDRFRVTLDMAFAEVVTACADRPETWINPAIRQLYLELHRLGHAHSVEIRVGGGLAGGLYGVALGAAFFGESMFSRARDTSKFALVALVARLNAGGFRLLDTQFLTDHLARLGAIEVSRLAYRRGLEAALARPADFRRLPAGTGRGELLALASPGGR